MLPQLANKLVGYVLNVVNIHCRPTTTVSLKEISFFYIVENVDYVCRVSRKRKVFPENNHIVKTCVVDVCTWLTGDIVHLFPDNYHVEENCGAYGRQSAQNFKSSRARPRGARPAFRTPSIISLTLGFEYPPVEVLRIMLVERHTPNRQLVHFKGHLTSRSRLQISPPDLTSRAHPEPLCILHQRHCCCVKEDSKRVYIRVYIHFWSPLSHNSNAFDAYTYMYG